ncbi:MAG: LCP family protein [Oscillospiraceae bacterium]|nr:LCP family protein [Oscillospiraceae bacterium]
MDNDKKNKYRYFFFSFSAAFFMLSLTFLFLVLIVRPTVPDSLAGEPELLDGASVYIPKKEDALTVLFVGASPDLRDAGMIMVVRFDPVSGEMPVIVLPPQTAVSNNGKTEPFSQVYRYGGAEYAKDALAETLGVPVDRYVKMNAEAFVKAIDMIGFVEFQLPEPVTVTRAGAASTMNRGKQLLNGQKSVDVMTYKHYPGGFDERLFITGELTAALINQRMDICLSIVSDNVFEKIINLVSTDISYGDYHTRKPAAEFLAKLGDDPAYTVEASGELSGDGSLFVLSDTFYAKLSQIMR